MSVVKLSKVNWFIYKTIIGEQPMHFVVGTHVKITFARIRQLAVVVYSDEWYPRRSIVLRSSVWVGKLRWLMHLAWFIICHVIVTWRYMCVFVFRPVDCPFILPVYRDAKKQRLGLTEVWIFEIPVMGSLLSNHKPISKKVSLSGETPTKFNYMFEWK